MERRIDLISGIVLCAIGVLGIAVLIPVGIQEPASVEFAALSPSYWPRIVCGALAGMGFVVAAATFFGADDAGDDEQAAIGDYPIPIVLARIAAAIGLMFSAYFLLEPLGFVVTGALVLAVFMVFAGERSPVTIASISAGVPLFLFFFFTKVANIPIPNGVLRSVLGGG